MDWMRILAGTVTGVGAGLVVLPLLTILMLFQLAPDALKDGQSFLIIVFTTGFGALIGGVVGAVWSVDNQGHHRVAGVIALTGGVILWFASLFLSWMSYNPDEGIAGLLRTLLAPWAGCPLAWGTILIGWGTWLLYRASER